MNGVVKFILASAAAAILCLALPCVAQSQDSDTPANQSWSASGEQRSTSGNLNSTRTTTKHIESNGRTVDSQSLERVGMDGWYVPYLDVERESVKVDATTTRTIERTYGRDPDGRRQLVQVTEEETRTRPDGGQKVMRNVSSPDVNGGMQLVRREVQTTKRTNPNVQDIKTTVLVPDVNGGLRPAMQIEERQTTRSDQSVQFKKSTSLPDGAGNMQVMEVRQGTITRQGEEQSTKDESVLRPDADGRMAVAEHTVTKESKSESGEGTQTVETYSTAAPGMVGNEGLRLTRREVTVQRKRNDGGQTTEQNVAERNPGNPGDSPRITQKTIDMVRPGLNGPAVQSRTTLSPDSTGSLGVVFVDIGKTSNPGAIQVDTKAATPPTVPAAPTPHQ
jgi:hypothetical protein